MDEFYQWLGSTKSKRIRLAVMDMWKLFRASTLKAEHAPHVAILFDKFHVLRHLGAALETVRKTEYSRLTGKDRRLIKGQKSTLLSDRENLKPDGRRSLRLLLKANRRLNTSLHSQGRVRAALGALLAAPDALREVCRDDRSALGRHRGLL